MDPAIQSLEPIIRQILTAPGTDLSTISAKRVRKQLLDLDSSLTADYVRDKKSQIDEFIAKVYEEISGSQRQAEEEEVPLKRKREDALEGEGSAAPKKVKKTKTKQELTDEELARQLQNEINSRSRTSRAASSKPKANGTKRGKKGPKSSATVKEDGEEDGDNEDKPKKRGGGFKKEYMLSEPLGTLLGLEKCSRPQIVKHLWDHIKANNMQNPENKKEIICDDSFRSIFKCDRIDMFKMNKELGQHLYEAPVES
ncbi:SWIB/MDM2 domain-containing protein [Fomes fomentarius]|nr:SWIB/MDM2 domain-containing protein [Fomes fomentarius]